MSTSAYYLDVSNPVYRDMGCPSQCMSNNEYTTVPDYYSFGTDPKSALLSNIPNVASANTGIIEIPSTFGIGSVDAYYSGVPSRFNQPAPIQLNGNGRTGYAYQDTVVGRTTTFQQPNLLLSQGGVVQPYNMTKQYP